MTVRHTKQTYLDSLPQHLHERYDYSRVDYKGNKEKIEVVCRKHNTSFWVTANNHQRGKSGCPICKGEAVSTRNRGNTHGAASKGKSRRGIEHYASAFLAAHGTRYEYDWDSFTVVTEPMRIRCERHGWFMQTPMTHKKGSGCPECAWEPMRLGSGEIRRRLELLFPQNTYTDVPNTRHTNITFLCPVHGEQTQSLHFHLAGHGCRECGWDVSIAAALAGQTGLSTKPVREIKALIESMGVATEAEYTPRWLNRMRLDLFVPEHNLAIEYGGSHVHNSTASVYGGEPKDKWYHYDKWKLCRDNGVTLLTIYDFDWFSNREKWEAVIKHKIQKADRRVYARKCQLVPVERAVAREFCKAHHIEGVGGMWKLTTECKGLEYAGELVAVMACEEGDIKRSCTLSGTAVIGGVSKLFKAFPG